MIYKTNGAAAPAIDVIFAVILSIAQYILLYKIIASLLNDFHIALCMAGNEVLYVRGLNLSYKSA